MTTNNNEKLVLEIRDKLNLVNQGVLNPEHFENTDEAELQEMHAYVTSKSSFTPSEITAIADALGKMKR